MVLARPRSALLIIITHLLILGGCAPRGLKPESQFVLGTICTISLYGTGKPEIYSKVFLRLRELEEILSANSEGTDLDLVNRNAGLRPVKVRPELIEVLEKALEYADKSRGYFNPAIGPLVKLWGIGTDNARVPAGEEIPEALSLTNYHEVEINKKEGTVFLRRPGMALDLGAIAKGYAADEAARLLLDEGIERGIIDLGGDILALGEKKTAKSFARVMGDFLKGSAGGGNGEEESPDEDYWRIGIQDPRELRGMYLGVLSVKNKSVVTSGTYERYFEEGGKRYHHILSIETGFPAENGLLSLTVAADKAVDADALSTAAFAMGWERGRQLIAAVPGAEGVFVFEDLSVRLTPGIAKNLVITGTEYRLVD